MKLLTVSIDIITEGGDVSIECFAVMELPTSLFKKEAFFEPIAVKETGNGYKIVIGQKRYRSALLAGLKEITVMLMPEEVQDSYSLALDDNGHRRPLTDVEKYITLKLDEILSHQPHYMFR